VDVKLEALKQRFVEHAMGVLGKAQSNEDAQVPCRSMS
jgi:hypothetical protein